MAIEFIGDVGPENQLINRAAEMAVDRRRVLSAERKVERARKLNEAGLGLLPHAEAAHRDPEHDAEHAREMLRSAERLATRSASATLRNSRPSGRPRTRRGRRRSRTSTRSGRPGRRRRRPDGAG
jgi:hypothetical protein